MYKIKRYFKGVFKQGKMVRWPTAKDLLGYFTVVVVVIVFSAVACSIDDFVIAYILGVLERELGGGTGTVSSTQEALRMVFNYLTMIF